jgi:prepilin-type N-terminal cleavage/methylation domain-containing protein
MRKMSSRHGFTLAEVLVTVTIVAVLAAVMVPAVLQQVGKGDSPAAAEDVGAIRTAITSFAADTRRFPSSLTELSGSTLLGSNTDISGNTFGTDAVNYRGPYLPTGPGSHIVPAVGSLGDTIIFLSGTAGLICLKDDSTLVTATYVSKVSRAGAMRLDSALDNGNGFGTGVVKWTRTPNTTSDTAIVAGTLRVCVASK